MIPRATAKDWLREVNLDVPLDMPVEKLSLGERQLLEIARGLGQSCKILVLDEPTAALSHDEAERLFTVVRRLCAAGTAVLFISHKFEEIEAIADDVTVLRDGRTVIDGVPLADVTRDQLVQAMLGVSVEATRRALPQPGDVLVRSEGLRLDRRGAPIDLAIRSGEIVGLAGLVGSGALEIASAVAAALPATGRLTIGDERIEGGDRRRAASLGIGYVPGDRHADGLFPVLPALQNASAGSLEVFTAAGMISRRREAQGLTPWLRRLKLHPFDIDRPASGFSGGNQQKLIIARNLALPGLRALVLLEPTRGVDIAARETIHDAVVDAAKRGIAVLLASTDLDEILALSHRILVVRDRTIQGELPRETDALRGYQCPCRNDRGMNGLAIPSDNTSRRRHLRPPSTLWIATAIFLLFVLAVPRFATAGNLENVLRVAAILAIVACGQAIVLILGGIEFSFGASAALASVMIVLYQPELGTVGGFAVGAATIIAVGAINGVLIAQFELAPFIATLGTLMIGSGLAATIAGGLPIDAPATEAFSWPARGLIADLPVPIAAAGVSLLILYGLLDP